MATVYNVQQLILDYELETPGVFADYLENLPGPTR